MKGKDKILIKGLVGAGIALLASYIIFTPAILIAKPSVGKAFALGVPPMVIIALSWMIGCWWALDKSFASFATVTIAMIPVRVVIYIAWMLFVIRYIPEVSLMAMLLSSISHWIVFMIPEVITFIGFSKIRGHKPKMKVEVKEMQKVETDEAYKHLLLTRLQSVRRDLRYKV